MTERAPGQVEDEENAGTNIIVEQRCGNNDYMRHKVLRTGRQLSVDLAKKLAENRRW